MYLVGVWVWHAVWVDDSVAVEVVVGGWEASVVAAVGPDGFACHLACAAESLVDEVPDVAALIVGVLAYHVPVFLESAA